MTDTIARLARRVVSEAHSVGPAGSEFIATPKATLELVQEAEEQLGFPLPPLLRRSYLEVANGGFGPGCGVMGIRNGFTDGLGKTVVDLYSSYRQVDPDDPSWEWPRGLLPICHWGCAVYSAVDAVTEGNPVFYMDVGVKGVGAPMSTITIPHKTTLQDWLEDWLEGKDLWMEVWG